MSLTCIGVGLRDDRTWIVVPDVAPDDLNMVTRCPCCDRPFTEAMAAAAARNLTQLGITSLAAADVLAVVLRNRPRAS